MPSTKSNHDRKRFFNPPRAIVAILLCWLLLVTHTSHAGQPCEEITPSTSTVEKGLYLGQKTWEQLEQSGAEVALIARVGQDLGKYGLKHSHMGFVLKNHPNGKWTVMHMLNSCGKPDSGLYAEGLGTFFMDTPFRYEAQIAIPSAEIQARLKSVLTGNLPRTFKAARYNMLAYPYNTASQNSNGWVLELLSVGLAGGEVNASVQSRTNALSWARSRGYTPTTLHIPALERLGANLTRANISFDDHPFNRRMAGKIDTVTVVSVMNYLQRNDAAMQMVDVVL
jgi:hypothetical protein